MGLNVQSLFTDATLWVAILDYEPSCNSFGEPFQKVGWYAIAPNQTVTVIDGDLENRYYAIYGEASNGDITNGSPNLSYEIIQDRFWQCSRSNTGMNQWVQFALIDVGSADDATVHITPPGWTPPPPPPPSHHSSWPGDDDDDDDDDDDEG
jgi:hypothetical protein